MKLCPVLRPLALSLLVSFAHAETLVVDGSGGPGDFPTIQSALDAAVPGDVVRVLPGSYSNFVLSKGVTLVGDVPPELPFQITVTGTCRVEGLPAGELARVSSLRIPDFLIIQQNVGLVVLDRIAAGNVTILSNDDVRVHRFDNDEAGGVGVVGDGRIEFVDSLLVGRKGVDSVCSNDATDGSAALEVRAGAEVHLSRTELFGGAGGSVGCGFQAADGGPALRVLAGGLVWVTGEPGSVLQGGAGGLGEDCALGGLGGPAVRISDGIFAHSLVALRSGESCNSAFPPVQVLSAGAVIQKFEPGLPTLGFSGSVPAGSPASFEVHGPPDAPLFLFFGSGATQLPYPESLLGILTLADLGFVSGSTDALEGSFEFPFVLPAALPTGTLIPSQAVVLFPNNVVRLTNSVSVLVL